MTYANRFFIISPHQEGKTDFVGWRDHLLPSRTRINILPTLPYPEKSVASGSYRLVVSGATPFRP